MYIADQARYQEMKYQRCGQSGLKLSRIALGMWHNFGGVNSLENSREMMCYAFDHGITYFDLANNYGPPYGSAEETFGKIMRDDFRPYRDEMVIASKAGYDMGDVYKRQTWRTCTPGSVILDSNHWRISRWA